MRRALLPCLAALGALATLATHAAADGEDAIQLEVAVGTTVTRDVGIALGLRCDDVSLARVALHTTAAQTNVFEATGLSSGTTLCRVGTTLYRPTFLFELHVVPAPHR